MSFAYHYDVMNLNDSHPIKTVKGVLSIEGDELLFEYKLYDPSGTVISTLNKFSLLVGCLKNVVFKKGFFSASMTIISTQMVFLDPLPGSSQGKITMKISREDRNTAQDFATQLNIALSERKLRDLDD